MDRWDGIDAVPPGHGRCVATIGVFDGVHRGHRYIVTRAVERARAAGMPAAAVTFEPHPVAVLHPGAQPPCISTLDHRLELFEGLGVDIAWVLRFTRELAALSPEEFVRDLLVARLRVAAVVIGQNFRFGHRAAGDVALLDALGREYGFTVEGVPLLGDDDGTLSSTYVRERLAVGDVDGATRALGRPYHLEGVVVTGDNRGRDLGFPTANIDPASGTVVPADGIYAGWLVRGRGAVAERLPAAISIGTNPTFDGTRRSVEAYVLDRDDLDLYGERVAFEFAARLRETIRFDSVDDLVAQMARDVEQARRLTG